YAIDLRGFGGSTYHNRVTSIKDFSDDLKQFVDALNLDNFSLVGWSTGGAVSMQFAADYPHCCDKIVLLASASTRGYPMISTKTNERLKTIKGIEKDAKTIRMKTLYNEKNYAGLRKVWNAVIYTHNQPEEARYQMYLEDMTTQRNIADVYHALNTFNISAHHNGLVSGTNEIKNIHIPILDLYGDHDYVVTKEMTEEIVEDLGDCAQLVILQNVGHSPLIDDLPQLKTVIENFIR